MRQARRVTAALLAGSLALAGCSSDDEAEAVPPIGGEDADDSSTGNSDDEDAAAVDDGDESDLADDEEPFAVPDEIDEDYAEQVINALLEIDTEILVTALEQQRGEPLDVEAVDKLHAVTVGEQRAHLLSRLQEYVDGTTSTDGLVPAEDMTATAIDVDAVLHAEEERCMIVAGWWDLRGTAVEPNSRDDKTVFSLSRIARDVTSLDRNPTPWALRDIAPLQDTDGGTIPPAQWESINFGEALDRSCEDL